MNSDGVAGPSDAELVEALSVRFASFARQATGHLVSWIEEAGLGIAEMRVFLTLAEGEALTGAELAERVGLPVETIFPAMHKLGARGWLTEESRRHSLGPEGHESLKELAELQRAAIGDFVRSLPEQERRDLAIALCGPGP